MKPTARILVIEDNLPSRELLVYLLKEFGHTVLTAIDGVAGVETARREHPDLVLCDVTLPKLDGYGVVRELKEDATLQNIPVIAVTALAMPGDRDKILAAGFDGYITKPIASETFVAEIESFLPANQRANICAPKS